MPHWLPRRFSCPAREVSEMAGIAALDLVSAVAAGRTGTPRCSHPEPDHDSGDANVHLIQRAGWRKEEQTTSTTSTHARVTSTPGPILANSIPNPYSCY